MAVSRAEKAAELGELEAAFRAVDTAVLVDFRGITVPQVTELRRRIRAAGGTYRVVKNTLARRAIAGTPFEAFTAQFVGTTAVVSTATDPVAVAKALTTFAKTTPSVVIKGAVVQGQPASAADVSDLANLPGKAELYGRLLYVLQAPMQGLVTVLSGVPRGLVTVLSEYEKKQAQG
jgi:large subunit ribosomal protein L10